MEKRQSPRAAGIPSQLTGLVGRRPEIREVRRLLSVSRLVTLAGVGGVGKTRLALQTATATTRAFPDGVCVVELAGLRDAKLLAQGMATALGVVDRSGGDLSDAVVSHLRDRRLLLLLDNCEHLVDACAQSVATLLQAAPGLHVLATSRQVLGVTGEHVFLVPPLPTPEPGRLPPVRELLRLPSVALFEQRAGAVLPAFKVTEQNSGAVAQLVRRLEGLPLAIELAAASMRTLTLQEILSRLEDRFALLTLGNRAALPRQRTLRELIDWSHALCTEPEQALWARVSVFSGGFDLQAAASVCAGPDLPARDIVERVNGLVEKSVLTRQERDGNAWYQMLETLREYGQDRLAEAGELLEYRRRHRDHYLDLTSRAQAQWFGPEQAAWFTRLRHDHANLRAALDFCLTVPGEAAAGLSLAVAPRHYWITLGSLSEGRRWLARLLAAEPGECPVRATALGTYAYLGVLQGEVEEALPTLALARETAERLGNASALAWTLHHQAMAALFRMDLPQTAALLSDAVDAHRSLGDVGGATECRFKLAIVVWFLGDHERALALCGECEATTAAHGDSWVSGLTLFAKGYLQWLNGSGGAADALAREAIRLMRPFNDWWDIAMCVELLAWNAAADGAPRRAAQLLGVLQSLWASVGGRYAVAPFMVESHRQCRQEVRAALDGKEFDRAFRRGAALALGPALDYALQEADSPAGPPTGAGGGGPAEPGPARLTRRERDVAELVAAGLSNREIAARLVIAQRTAENHVERILAKLGFTSRTQVAVWVYQQQAAADRP